MVTTARGHVTQQMQSYKINAVFTRLFVCASVLVILSVFAVTRLRGIAAMTQETVLDCHAVSGVAHTHSADCYDKEGNLVCPLPEVELHVHDDSCYTETRTLVCGLEESEGHTHTDGCYDADGNLVCGLEESEGHVHTDACYEVTRELTCGKEEVTQEHVHGPGCFRTVTVEAADDSTSATLLQPSDTEDMPSQTFTQQFKDKDGNLVLQVDVAAEDGQLPAGTTMMAQWMDPETLTDGEQEAVDKALATKTDGIALKRQVVRISFADASGAEIEPKTAVGVTLTTSLAVKDDAPVVVNLQRTSELNLGEDEMDANRLEKIVPSAKVTDILNDKELDVRNMSLATDQLAFDARNGAYATYVLATTSQDLQLKSESDTVTVTVDAPASAGVPRGSSLKVVEIVQGSDVYRAYADQALEAVGAENARLARFFDITIVDADGQEVQPAAPVAVKIKLTDAPSGEQSSVVHFDEDGASVTPEVIPADVNKRTTKFEAESFSVYGVVYTVDFHWEVNGRMYEFSLPGGGFVSFEHLIEALCISHQYENGLAENGKNSPENADIENPTEVPGIHDQDAMVLTLDGVEVSEKTREFVADVESVVFSSPELVDVSKVENETTVEGIIESRGLDVQHSAKLTEEQTEEINSTAVKSGDWALISLRPFDTTEMLTVTMKTGETFTIQVTDAQMKKTVITASGDTYEITVTYDETAGIPEGADLRVSELTEEHAEYATYMERTAETVDAEVPDIRYIKFLDISIVDESGNKVVPSALVDVQIELLDKNNEGEETEDSTQIVHFTEMEDAVEPELLDNTAEGSTVSFRTDSFSVYAIVSGPLASPAGGWHSALSGSEIDELMSEGTSLYIWENSGKWLKNTNSGSSNGIDTTGTAPTGTENYEYYFEKVEAAEGEDDSHLYYIYCLDSDGNKQYLKITGTATAYTNRGLTYTGEKADATAFKLSFTSNGEVRFSTAINDTDGNRLYWVNSSSRIIFKDCYDKSKKTIDPTLGSEFRILYKNDTTDTYGLDGKSYSILKWDGGNTAKALTSDQHEDDPGHLCAEFLTVMSRAGENTDKIYVPNDTSANITTWTFNKVSGSQYKLSAEVNGDVKYLKMDSTGLHMVDESEASKITVSVGSGIHAGQIMLSVGSGSNKQTLTYSGTFADGFQTNALTPGLEWLYIAEAQPESVIDDYTKLNSAVKISVSDDSLLPQYDGDKPKQIILYTRAWNGHGYTYFAIDGNGKLVPVAEDGDTIEWIGSGTDELLWDFTVYGTWEGDDFTPSNYYEFKNATTDKYLAPLMAIKDEDGNILKEAQILSGDTIGVIMPGRKNGQYYSKTLVWDTPNYAYAGISVDLDTGEGAVIEACPRREALDIYFAVVEPKQPDDELKTVPTVDNNLYGIEMYMVNFAATYQGEGWQNVGGCDTTLLQSEYLGEPKYLAQDQTSGLLSTNLDENGYPTSLRTNKNLSGLYAKKIPVNHLFIESTYDATGYYVYDSTQNYATLYQNGVLTNDFTVYQGIGTYDRAWNRSYSTKPSLKHGQFFPYNDIHAGLFAEPTNNGLNLYDTTQQPLPENDPRYGEQLYLLTNPQATGDAIYNVENQHPDCWFGMELKASFVQTPSGLDEWGHDIIFEFSGDDDFWLYVDGELVIDLGGVHGALPGSVNFRTGKVSVNGTDTTLYQLFHDHYIARGMSEAEAQKKLYGHGKPGDEDYEPGIFEDKNDPDYGPVTTFKDNSNHTMKIFYMERGAGASNLNMRFNLSAVKKGTVQLTKELKELKGDEVVDISENSIAVYPYQIWYQDPRDNEYRQLTAAEGSVKYLGSIEDVTYRRELDVDYYNSTAGETERVKYNDVFLVHPAETIEITFPTFGEDEQGNPLYVKNYQIVECGVDPDVFEYVKVNDTRINPKSVTTKYVVDESGNESEVDEYTAHLVNFEIPFDTMDARARVTYENVAKETEKMTIQKELYKKLGGGENPEQIVLYDEDGEPIDQNNPELLRKFNFRLEFKTLIDQYFNPANVYTYHVIDPAGYYCKWLPANPLYTDPNDPRSVGKFVRIKKNGQPVRSLDDLDEDEQLACTFDTSMNGAISQIPAYYKVEIVGLLPGTQYKVVERITETPDGYQFWQYALNGEPYDVEYVEDGITGTISADVGSDVLVRNYKGYALRLVKDWADAATVKDRDPAYFAVYYETKNEEGDLVRQVLVPDSVRMLDYRADPQELLWSYLNLPDVDGFVHDELHFHNYVVREVVLENPVVDANGNITYGAIHPLDDSNPVVSLNATATAASEPELVTYRVDYADPVEIGDNYREFTVTNTPTDRPPVKFYKENWNDRPLGDADFILKHGDTSVWGTTGNDNQTPVAKTSRASDGWIATEFLTKGETYTLTETSAPQGYIGLQKDLSIKLEYDENAAQPENAWSLRVTPSVADTGYYYKDVEHVIVKSDDDVIIEEYFKVIIKDRPYELQVLKTERDSDNPVSGAVFELYKQKTQSTGTSYWDQVAWTEGDTVEKTITSGTDGIIPRLDNTLEPGTYQLREIAAPSEYLSLTEEYKNNNDQNYGYINFTVGSLGEVTLGAHPDVVELTAPSDEGEAVYKLEIPDKRIIYEVKLSKVDESANPLLGSKFELTVKADSWIKVDLDPDTEGDQNEIDLTSVSEKILRLKNGFYRLRETKTQDGYLVQNADTYFTVQDGVVCLTDGEGNAIYDETVAPQVENNPYVASNGNIYTDIVPPLEDVTIYTIRVWNYPGVELPHTGGPGTALLYLLGITLMGIGAFGVLLRMKKGLV